MQSHGFNGVAAWVARRGDAVVLQREAIALEREAVALEEGVAVLKNGVAGEGHVGVLCAEGCSILRQKFSRDCGLPGG